MVVGSSAVFLFISAIHYTTYAVRTVPAFYRTRKSVLPAAAWYMIYLFHKNLHLVQIFVKKSRIFRPAGGDIPRQASYRTTGSPNTYLTHWVLS
jgi:hypothetical protein